jgi:stage IV sporulation protein FB
LALFNLLPALPLDGGRILRAILSCRRDYRDATAIVVTISYSIICILVILTGTGYWLYNTINLTMLVAALFLFITVRAEKNLAGFRAMRILANKKTELLGRQVMPTSHLTAMESAMLGDIIRLFGPEKYYIIHIIDQNFKLCGALTETEVWEGLVQKGIKSRINEFL